MVLEMEDVSLNPLIIREELQLQMETGKQLKAGLNPLIIREELQLLAQHADIFQNRS